MQVFLSADGFLEPSGSVHTMAWQLFLLYGGLISIFYHLLSSTYIIICSVRFRSSLMSSMLNTPKFGRI